MPSATSHARGAASRAADNTWLERLTRAGFLGYGVLHVLFAYVIVQVAFGGPGADGDQSGAMHKLAEEPFGAALIVVMVIGLVAMAVWQVLEIFTCAATSSVPCRPAAPRSISIWVGTV